MGDIKSVKKEYEEIINQISNPELASNWEEFERISKRKKYLERIIDSSSELEEAKRQIEENKMILKSSEEPDLISLAEVEIKSLEERKKVLTKEIEELLKEDKDASESFNSVIIEIRAGTGGDEAALFAADLYRMYSKYASSNNLKQKILDSHSIGIGGFKEIIFEIDGPDIYSKMKYEGGVHRVQRIPKTEKAGRVHTSTATVAILPKPKATEIKIKPDEIRTDFYRASGPGGQYVNRRETAVRITHIPTGIVVTSQTERNQLQNKENALAILSARLLEKKQLEELSKIASDRKSQVGWAKRAEKIRTYNFPQGRVTDHRIKKTWYDIEKILNGEIEKIIDSLISAQSK
ncbi:MAG: peptide chain release factor 1 [Candidatus Pacebacteria bacterium]|nr:peptide chain release factor 1 [Candidatus Paceibacterota bacterium]